MLQMPTDTDLNVAHERYLFNLKASKEHSLTRQRVILFRTRAPSWFKVLMNGKKQRIITMAAKVSAYAFL